MEAPTRSVRAGCALSVRLAGGSAPLAGDDIALARRHGVHLVLAISLTEMERAEPWARDLLRELRTAAAFQERRDALLREAIEALAAASADVLVIKGAALAHTIYPEPYVRPRVDVDLLVDRADLARADRVLEAEGWLRDAESDAEWVSGQRHYTKALGSSGRVERLDLHWRVVNPLVFAEALSFAELRERAVPVASLGPSARTPAIGDALLLACLHRLAHHADDTSAPALLWLHDISLLVARLDAAGRSRFFAIAGRPSLRQACRAGLAEAADRLGSTAAAALAADLPASRRDDPGARFLERASPYALMRADLAVLPSWRERAALVREHLFPSMKYMRARYPRCPAALLPLAAVYRIAAGAPAWLRKKRA